VVITIFRYNQFIKKKIHNLEIQYLQQLLIQAIHIYEMAKLFLNVLFTKQVI